jgi:hypothetical protein
MESWRSVPSASRTVTSARKNRDARVSGSNLDVNESSVRENGSSVEGRNPVPLSNVS